MNLNPALFKQYATLNIQAILSIIRIETKVFFQTRPMLISQILTPLMYFLFIIAALADMIGDVTINGTTVPYTCRYFNYEYGGSNVSCNLSNDRRSSLWIFCPKDASWSETFLLYFIHEY